MSAFTRCFDENPNPITSSVVIARVTFLVGCFTRNEVGYDPCEITAETSCFASQSANNDPFENDF